MTLPIGWELKELQKYPGRAYYYNKKTHESTWIRPCPYPGLQSDLKNKEFVWPPLISVQYILIKYGNHSNNTKFKGRNINKEEAEQKINQIFTRITEGEKFEEIASKESDSISTHENWDLGWISKNNNLDPKFEEIAWNLDIGELSSPVETAYGWQIILRNG